MKYNTSEAQEQRVVIDYCHLRYPDVLIYHIPNGGSRDAREAHNLKLQGVVPGIPDLHIPVARNGYHGLYIEMKRSGKGARVSEDQKRVLAYLDKQCYKTAVCYGADEAIKIIDEYLWRDKS